MDSNEFLNLVASDESAALAALEAQPELAHARTKDGASALQWAAYMGRTTLFDPLVKAGAPLDLASACAIGRPDAIADTSNVDSMSADGFTPLCLAVAFGHNDVVRLLLARGANPNLRSKSLGGVAPIHSAVFGRNCEGVRLLVEAGADANAVQGGGFTALHGAAQHGDLATVTYLLGVGADPAMRTDDGKTAADLTESADVRAALEGVTR